MKKLVLKYGLISGLIVSTTLILSAIVGIETVMMGDYGMVVGFGSMIIAFAFTTLSTYMRFRDVELRYARLARAIALEGAKRPEDH